MVIPITPAPKPIENPKGLIIDYEKWRRAKIYQAILDRTPKF
jgi:hypothetical protein